MSDSSPQAPVETKADVQVPPETKVADFKKLPGLPRRDIHTTALTARAIIPNGIYTIRSYSKPNLCLQLNTSDKNSITASPQVTTGQNPYQQWIVTIQSDHTYKFTNLGRDLEIGAVIQVCAGNSPGYISGTTQDTFWLLTALNDTFIIGYREDPYVVDLNDAGTGSNRMVTLNLFDPENQLEKQLWFFDLYDGTAPETQILPGYSYLFTNIGTGRVLALSGNTPYMYGVGTGPGSNTSWLPIFDAYGRMYIATTYPRGAPPTTVGYLTNGNISTTPVVCRLKFAEPATDGVFYINVNSELSGDVVADNTLPTNYASFEPLNTSKITQKWKMTRVNQ
ncbi:hypothetical protein JAAARDRAFT_194592 [Jaapia argillacea MUCL 33604]|uniref:Uncharacterized protein n=1 Tax=Jaapia argillacea MUCL 33604 TaxID=933084 RepID=A0A067PZB7_9AGAM|nr:hypothetical protein JAAARDRAFT_194592 [Jaapia argillacea MUCL 33604]